MQHNKRFRWYLISIALAIAAISVTPAAGQETSGLQIYDEELRVQLDKQEIRKTGFDAGGWFNFAFTYYDDAAARRRRNLRRYELRGWGSLNLQGGTHKFYVRGLLRYDDWDTGNNPTNQRGDDFDEELERAWYQFDLTSLLLAQTGKSSPYGLRFRVGRDFTTIGTALVLSIPLDQVRLDVTLWDWEFMALLGQTIRDTRNIDDSQRVANHQERTFYGFELKYKGFSHHQPFVYYLSNSDHTTPSPLDSVQSYDYSSRYIGVGSTGTLLPPDLSYSAEVVGEWGRTYSEGANAMFGQDEICAFAADVSLEYHIRTKTNPRVMVEYLFGSGDSDRRVSTNSTVGGNRMGTRDKAFNAFGFRDTGIALAPSVSNIHIYTVGARFFPLEHIRFFKKMEVGSKVFFYQKAIPTGPISDSLAGGDAHWLGWEWDVYCNWRITSDLALTARYGAFQPGSAYDGGDKTCRQFFYTGIVFSF